MKAIELHRELTRIWQGETGWRGVFSSVSHTDLGKRFIVAAAVFFGIGGVLAMLIRAQLATPQSAFAGPEVYGQIFTMHGSIMMFLFAIPMLEGLAIYLLPKMLGARDLAYPRLTALGWWCYLFGGTIMILALLGGGRARCGLVSLPPAFRARIHPRRQFGRLAARHHIRRDFRDVCRDRDRGDYPEVPRREHVADQNADHGLVSSGDGGNDDLRLPAAHPGVDPT